MHINITRCASGDVPSTNILTEAKESPFSTSLAVLSFASCRWRNISRLVKVSARSSSYHGCTIHRNAANAPTLLKTFQDDKRQRNCSHRLRHSLSCADFTLEVYSATVRPSTNTGTLLHFNEVYIDMRVLLAAACCAGRPSSTFPSPSDPDSSEATRFGPNCALAGTMKTADMTRVMYIRDNCVCLCVISGQLLLNQE